MADLPTARLIEETGAMPSQRPAWTKEHTRDRTHLTLALTRGLIGATLVSALTGIAFLSDLPIILTSWASSTAVILYRPSSPGAHPRRILVAHLLSATIGVLVRTMTGPSWWPIGIAIGLALMLAILLDAEHAPAIANAAIVLTVPVAAGPFLVTVLVGALILAPASLLLRRASLRFSRAVPPSPTDRLAGT